MIGSARSSSPPAHGVFHRQDVPEHVFLSVLDEVTGILERLAVPYGFIGGVASHVYGRSRYTDDIDVFLRPQDARLVLDELNTAGFTTDETYPEWLFKATRDGVLVDLIFTSTGGIYLDDEMRQRVRTRDYMQRTVKLIAPEDLVVMKALAHEESTARYWFDALAILALSELDWPYLLQRARHGPRRVLALLIYARSADLLVPHDAVSSLWHDISEASPGPARRAS